MTNKEYSSFLVKSEHDYEYYLGKYPKRELQDGACVTRFAPSPTGFVHMGSLYTSFATIRFARQTKGVVYLRIEDTDGKRSIENGIEEIINDFNNLDISFDEDPIKGGLYGPYIQSERKDIYHAFVKYLIEKDLAYPCFCTEDDLNKTREEQEKNKLRIGYYGKFAKCRNLTHEEVIDKVNNHEPYIIRLKSQGDFNKKIILNDLIKGDIEMPENDLDIVLIKSDELPTYHFAHVIDDFIMGTTHVIRGDEWVSSYPVHHELFHLMNFPLPRFCHIAPITIKEGNTVRKLSKRKDPMSAISFYHELGIPKEVIFLYLATINNSDFEEWYINNPSKSINDFTFNFNKMPIGGSLFDIDKLYSISRVYFSSLKASDVYEGLVKYASEFDKYFNQILINNKEYSINVLNIEREKSNPRRDIYCYKGIKDLNWYMFKEYFDTLEKIYEWQLINNTKETKCLLNDYLNNYYEESDTNEEWFNKLKELSTKYGYAANMKDYKNNKDNYKGSISDICMALRVAITTKCMTPDLYSIMKVLGKEEIERRINLL